MKRNLCFACSLFLLMVLASCSKDLNSKIKTDSKWVLSAWPGHTLPANGQATLNISESSRIGGKSFCNSYGGSAVFNGNALQFSQVFGTKMYCEEFAAAETQYLNDLQAVNAGSLSGNKLSLMKDEKVLLIFTRVR